MRDLPDGRELEVGEDDDVAAGGKAQAGDQGVDSCESDVVTATSSGSAPTRSAKLARAASARPTQSSHGEPSVSHEVT